MEVPRINGDVNYAFRYIYLNHLNYGELIA